MSFNPSNELIQLLEKIDFLENQRVLLAERLNLLGSVKDRIIRRAEYTNILEELNKYSGKFDDLFNKERQTS